MLMLDLQYIYLAQKRHIWLFFEGVGAHVDKLQAVLPASYFSMLRCHIRSTECSGSVDDVMKAG